MRNSRSLVMIGLSLLAGLIAVVFGARWINAQAGQASKIVVAAVDVNIGSKLNAQMLELVSWPAGSVPNGAFTEIEKVDGRVVKTSLTKDEPILESKLAPVGTKGGLSAIVGEGKRAMTVRVNDVVGVAGFALPGNYVDILVNTQEEGAGNGNNKDMSISKIVLEHILVLAVAQEADRDDTKPKVVNAVTLEVTPEQAELLDLARSVGTLSLVLRNQIDPVAGQTEGATKAELLNLKRPEPVVEVKEPKPVRKKVARRARPKSEPKLAAAAPVAPAPKATENVEVIKGMDRFHQQFEMPAESGESGDQ